MPKTEISGIARGRAMRTVALHFIRTVFTYFKYVTVWLAAMLEEDIKENEAEPVKTVKQVYRSCLNTSKVLVPSC